MLTWCTLYAGAVVSGPQDIHGTRQRLIVMWLDSCLPGAFVGRLAQVLRVFVVSNQCRHHNWRDSGTVNEGVDVDECESDGNCAGIAMSS